MARKWIRDPKYPGVRYREHKNRMFNGKPDRYFTIFYKHKNKFHEEGLGWASQGWNLKKASIELYKLKEAQTKGEGPISLKEKKELADEERQRQEEEKRLQAIEAYTFGELMTEYLKWAQVNKKHWSNDEYRWRLHLSPYLADKPLKEVTPYFLEQMKNDLMKTDMAPASVKHCLVIVRQAFNKAILWEKWNGQNPTKGVKMPKVDNAKQKALSMEEEAKLMAALKEKSKPTYLMAMVSLYAGLRFGEVAGLHWQDIDFESNLITVKGKFDKFRTVPLAKTLKKLLQDSKPEQAEAHDLVFPSTKGTLRGKISATFPRTVDALGLNDYAEKR